MKKRSLAFPFLAAVLLAGAAGADPSDPTDPHGYSCLTRLDQWTAVRGPWALKDGQLSVPSDGIAFFSDATVKVPPWYQVSLEARGLASSREERVGLVVDCRDASN